MPRKTEGIYSFYNACGEKEMLIGMGFVIISNNECHFNYAVIF
jgi:hypothetical protein